MSRSHNRSRIVKFIKLLIQGQPVFYEQRTDTILNSCLIVEVLSKSTRNYDRTEKFRYYRSVPEIQEYILIDQYVKKEDNSWLFRVYESDAEKVPLATLNIEIEIADMYENVIFA